MTLATLAPKQGVETNSSRTMPELWMRVMVGPAPGQPEGNASDVVFAASSEPSPEMRGVALALAPSSRPP